ncbi:hypothetical protein Afe04nite_40140 [Asanoa ferruginea]|nr:hypothetical protein Afe04nite_40140 [Asanoa ferruginea]
MAASPLTATQPEADRLFLDTLRGQTRDEVRATHRSAARALDLRRGAADTPLWRLAALGKWLLL